MKKSLRWYLDLVFPWAEKPTSVELNEEADRQSDARIKHELSLKALSAAGLSSKEYLSEVTALLETERNRQQSVDNRLTSIIGLSSIAGTVVLGTMAEALGRNESGGLLPRLISIGIVYLAIQLCSAIAAAIRGLAQRGYEHLDVTDILPFPAETPGDYAQRRVVTSSNVLNQNRSQNNAKFTEMSVAHRALTNFICVLFSIALLGSIAIWLRHPGDTDLIQQLKTHHELQELLRGPQGPTGATGPPGPPGGQGPLGRDGRQRRPR